MTKDGPVQKLVTNPRSVNVGGMPFPPPIGDDEWGLLVAAWGAGKEVRVTYDPGPPATIQKVETMP